MPRPNFFFAFPVDGSFVTRLPDPPPTIRRFAPDDVHLTLAFLGGCGEAAAERALATLDALLGELRPAPLEVSLGEVVPMGPRRAFSALSALLTRGRTGTESLISTFRDPLMDAATRRRDRRPPKAHVTIARPMRRTTDAQRAAALDWAKTLGLHAVTCTLARIALYTWADDRPRRLFKIIADRPLR